MDKDKTANDGQGTEGQPEVEGLEDAALDKLLTEIPADETADPGKGGDDKGADKAASQPADGSGSGDAADTKTPAEGEGAKPGADGDPIAKLSSEIEALKARLSKKDEFIGRQSNEIGELRKELRGKAEAARAEAKNLMLESPEAAVEKVIEAREFEAQDRNLEAEEAVARNKEIVTTAIPDFDNLIGPIAEIAKGDGVPPQAIEAFKRNPFATSPGLLKNLAERARAAQKIRDLEEETKRIKENARTAAEKIARAAKAPPAAVSAAVAGTTDDDDVPVDIDSKALAGMTDEALDALVRKG